MRAFPTLLEFIHQITGEVFEYPLPENGPVMTLIQDLEKGRVFIRGKQTVLITHEEENILLKFKEKTVALPVKEKGDFQKIRTRLSLGVHKKQDWELVKRRRDLTEILPIWHAVSQMIPELEQADLPEYSDFLALFEGAFHGILVPHSRDPLHLGVLKEEIQSPLYFLRESQKGIERLFVEKKGEELLILPQLYPSFHAGRILNLQIEDLTLDLEWTKKRLRRMIIRPSKDQTLHLFLFKGLKGFRMNGKRYTSKEFFKLEADNNYYFDCFEK